MAKLDRVAVRYAKAVFEFLGEAKAVSDVISDLQRLEVVVNGHAELKSVLTSSVFTKEQRLGVMEDIAAKLKLSAPTVKILTMLARQRRLEIVGSLAANLNVISLESSGAIPIQVLASSELEKEERSKIEKRFEKVLGKTVQASYEIDPSLLGGVKVTAHGRTYDGSLAGSLATFEEQLVGGSI